MSGDVQGRVLAALKQKFRFKSEKGKWLQQGQCPDCDRWEAYCAAEDPKVVKCGRIDNCGWEASVRELFPDLFEDWTRRAPPTPEDPTATADAYLRHERGLDLTGLRGHFTQEWFQDRKRAIGTATVRFSLPNGHWWERFIDRPGRFEKKANFKWGGSLGGHWWQHPQDSFADLAAIDEIWITEGIFDACALRQVFVRAEGAEDGQPRAKGIALRRAVAMVSIAQFPEAAIDELRRACEQIGRKDRPRLVFAFDVGSAGVNAQKKYVKRAREEGWPATAAQVRPDGEGSKLDWNDLLLRHQAWRDDPEKAPLSEENLQAYVWNGEVTLAATPREKALLIQQRHNRLRAFDMRFDNRLFWVRVVFDKETESTDLQLDEISNCAFRILYRERDEAADETNYFIEIAFPNNTPTAKARFTAACCSASGEFKKRLFAFSGMWSGNQEQLDRLMRAQTRQLKTVEPLHFTGYSAAHKAWVLGDIAVRDGRVIPINKENYFELGKQAVKLRTSERMLSVTWDPDRIELGWVDDLWTAYGSQGLVTLAFFTMALFAQQIRDKHDSLGFLELTGEPGSGKSTLVRFLWKLLGRKDHEGHVPNTMTASALARTMTKVANLPVGLIEAGRRNDAGQQNTKGREYDWTELLTLFNGGSPRAVGVKSNGNETFEPPFLGAIYIMQNERIDAMDAVLERLMSFRLDKKERNETTKAAARRLSAMPVEQASGFIVHVTRAASKWLDYFFDRVDHHEKDMPRRVRDLHNDRCILNHSQLAAAVEALGHLLPVKPEWIAETLKLVDWMALDRQQSSGADHPLVRRFWEQVEYLDSLESDDAERPLNQHRKAENGLIAINLPHFEERARSRGQTVVPMDQLQKLLRGSKTYRFIEAKTINCADGKYRYCWVFQRPAAPASSPDSVF